MIFPDRLVVLVLVSVLMILPGSTAAGPGFRITTPGSLTLARHHRLSGADSSRSEVSEIEAAVFRAINKYRVSKGLPPLRVDERLAHQARRHSAAMATGQTGFGHDGFEDRVKSSGIAFRAAAENVGENEGFQDPAAQAVRGWLKSRGHRHNIEGNYNLTGIGVARDGHGRFYLTQLFLLGEK